MTVLSALALLPRFPASASSASSAVLHRGLGGAGLEDLVHRDYAALVAAIPAVAIGSLAAFALYDRVARTGEGAASDPETATAGDGALYAGLRHDEELALAGVVLAVMADRLEHDPVAYPLLARAAAGLVAAGPAGARWTGLTERARRAAVEVLRPTALATLVRAATWSLTVGLERL
ncbi:MAG TPA: hypothetical protein VFU73_04990 [Actinocrinis sp.]|nr:hypothetical protein [Actinocrinis sp.]